MTDREILIVDDDAAAREALAAVLSEHGFTVHQTDNGQNALKLLNAHRGVRVLLTDVRLPGMDGIELLAKVRLADPGVHVILVTAYAQRNLALRALKHGAADFLPKPVSAATLMSRRTLFLPLSPRQPCRHRERNPRQTQKQCYPLFK